MIRIVKELPKNIPVVNSYRAIGILIVCFAHYIVNVTGFFSGSFLPILHNVGYMAVIVFFTISGFVIPWWLFNSNYRLKDYGRFVSRRMLRIEPPYLIALIIAIAYTYLRSYSQHYNGVDTTPDFRKILLHLGYLIPFVENERWIRDSYWTLAIECQWYLLMGIMYPLFFHSKQWVRIFAYLMVLIPCHFIDFQLLHYFPILLLGSLLCAFTTNTIQKTEFLFLSGLYLFYVFFNSGWMTSLASLLILPMLLLFANYNNVKLNFIGNMSYSIYLMHSIAGTAFVNYFSHVVESTEIKILVVLGGVLITLGASYLFYIFVEKPAHKLSLRIAVNEFEFQSKK